MNTFLKVAEYFFKSEIRHGTDVASADGFRL